MLRKHQRPLLRFASDRLRDLAVKVMDPSSLTAIANACAADETGAASYWQATVSASQKANT